MFPNLLGLTGDLLLVLWLAIASFWAVAGMATASWLDRPRSLGLLLGAALPVLGPVGLLVVSGARRLTRRSVPSPTAGRRTARPRAAVRALTSGTAVVLAGAVVVVTGLRDTELSAGGDHRLLLSARDLGLTTPVVLTLVLVLGAAAVGCWRASRWAALAVAWCGSWWLLWALAALVLGETLEVLARAADLPGPLTAVVSVGPSWSLLLGVAALLLAWSVAVLLLPSAAGRRPSRRVPATPVASAATPGLPVPAPRAELPAAVPALPAATPSTGDLLGDVVVGAAQRVAQSNERNSP